jgi:hypothetical protein
VRASLSDTATSVHLLVHSGPGSTALWGMVINAASLAENHRSRLASGCNEASGSRDASMSPVPEAKLGLGVLQSLRHTAKKSVTQAAQSEEVPAPTPPRLQPRPALCVLLGVRSTVADTHFSKKTNSQTAPPEPTRRSARLLATSTSRSLMSEPDEPYVIMFYWVFF